MVNWRVSVQLYEQAIFYERAPGIYGIWRKDKAPDGAYCHLQGVPLTKPWPLHLKVAR